MDKLQLLDNYPEMVNSFVGDYHIWYGIRYDILRSIVSKYLKQDYPKTNFRLKNIGIKKSIKYLCLTMIKFPYFARNKKIIFFSSNVVNMKEDKFYVNRLYDFFHIQYDSTALLMEDSYQREYRVPRKTFVFYNDLIHLLAFIARKFLPIKKKDYKEIEEKIHNIKLIIGNEFDNIFWEKLFVRLQKMYKMFLIEKKIYFFFLKRINPKIIFREDGSYGGYQALTNACNQLNIIYAEFQHGLVSKNHMAYNYGEQFFKQDKLKKLLPAYLLTFGEYWSKIIRIPGKKIEIGFPYLQEKALGAGKCKLSNYEVKILVVSNGNLPETFQNLVEELADKKILNKPCVICFKLHPVEVPLLKEWYHKILSKENVHIKTYEPVYSLFFDADIVVGCSSTVMFEALQFHHKPYIYLNEISIANIDDMSFFETFISVNELIKKIEGNYNKTQNDVSDEVLNYLFNQHPEKNFKRFINNILGDV